MNSPRMQKNASTVISADTISTTNFFRYFLIVSTNYSRIANVLPMHQLLPLPLVVGMFSLGWGFLLAAAYSHADGVYPILRDSVLLRPRSGGRVAGCHRTRGWGSCGGRGTQHPTPSYPSGAATRYRKGDTCGHAPPHQHQFYSYEYPYKKKRGVLKDAPRPRSA